MSAVHWGSAMTTLAAGRGTAVYVASVVPAIVGWFTTCASSDCGAVWQEVRTGADTIQTHPEATTQLVAAAATTSKSEPGSMGKGLGWYERPILLPRALLERWFPDDAALQAVPLPDYSNDGSIDAPDSVPEYPAAARVLSPTAYDTLGVTFLGVFAVDVALVEAAMLPAWYLPLRVLLTTGVVGSLLVSRLRREEAERATATATAAAAAGAGAVEGGRTGLSPQSDSST